MPESSPKPAWDLGGIVDLSLLAEVGKLAGAAGVAIGSIALLVRQVIKGASSLPRAEQATRLVRLVAIAAFPIGVLGIVAWLMVGAGTSVTTGGSVPAKPPIARSSAKDDLRRFRLKNLSDQTIVQVQISGVGESTFDPIDLLGDATIPPGESVLVEPYNTGGWCRYDIRITFKNGDRQEVRDFNLCEAETLAIQSNGKGEEAGRKEKIEADRQAAEQKAAEDKRKAEAAAAEQAQIAEEKADKDAETKRLADEAASIKRKLARIAEWERAERYMREGREDNGGHIGENLNPAAASKYPPAKPGALSFGPLKAA